MALHHPSCGSRSFTFVCRPTALCEYVGSDTETVWPCTRNTGDRLILRMTAVVVLVAVFATVAIVEGAALPEGVTNTQQSADRPLSPQEALKKITVPPGFRVELFAGEPDVLQPIAFDFDDRGRLWVVESFSYPEFK